MTSGPSQRTRTYRFVLTCDDRPGIVHEVSRAVLTICGNIIENAQFTEPGSNTFVMRMRFDSPIESADEVHAVLGACDLPAGFRISLHAEDSPRRAMVMVSRFDHCLLDLLYRQEAGELGAVIAVIVSNHIDCAVHAERHHIPFVYAPVTAATKANQEAQVLALVAEHDIDFVILARYMQVLSNEMCRSLHGRAINIHHSFLPGFKGAKPYHQAHERGVKLIGATAHYVTGDLDEGPIIEQDVVRVSHAHTADDLVRIGRDVERSVMARAVIAHAQDRVVLLGDRTIVFV